MTAANLIGEEGAGFAGLQPNLARERASIDLGTRLNRQYRARHWAESRKVN